MGDSLEPFADRLPSSVSSPAAADKQAKKILRDGDIVSLDVVAKLKGYHGDACRTYPVGIVGEEKLRLIKVTEECFWEGVKLVKPGVRLGDVEEAIQKHAEENGYNVVREFTGHGIGREMHEDPYIPNYGKAGTGPTLREGMTICIEPMINMRGDDVHVMPNKWTVVTNNGTWSAHFEHMILITANGPVIMTKR